MGVSPVPKRSVAKAQVAQSPQSACYRLFECILSLTLEVFCVDTIFNVSYRQDIAYLVLLIN